MAYTTQENLTAWLADIVESAHGVLILGTQENLIDPPTIELSGSFFLVPTALQPRTLDLNNRRNKVVYTLVGMWSDSSFHTWDAALGQTNTVILGLISGNNPTGVLGLELGNECPVTTTQTGILQIELQLTITIEV